MSKYVLIHGQIYELSDDALMHYGVKGMKWGVRRYQNADGSLTPAGKKRDMRLNEKVKTLSVKASEQAEYAKIQAANKINGGNYLASSDRLIKRAERIARKMSDGGKNAQKLSAYKNAMAKNIEAGEKYVKRTAGEKAATLAATIGVSAGMVVASAAASLPYTVIFISSGPKYKLRGDDNA